jgi:hypothetical protein
MKMPGRSRIHWKINRLRSMTPGEILSRISAEASSNLERRTARRAKRAEWAIDACVSFPCLNAVKTVLFTDRDMREIAEACRTDRRLFSEDVSLANSVLDGDVPFFGGRLMHVGNPPDWHYDPFSGRRWALEYWKELLPGGEEVASEPRVMWELHRCHHLVYLAKGYAATKREEFAESVVRQIDDWYMRNPYLNGIGWAGGLECSIRAVNWVAALELIRDSKVSAAVSTEKVCRWLYGQASFIRDHLSTYASSRNNHLIGEAAGLFLLGLALGDSREGAALAQLGRRLLESEIERQVHDDGFDKELSTSYQRFVAQFFLVCLRAGSNNSIEFSTKYRARVDGMVSALRYLVAAFGELPNFGDNDEGVLLPLGRGSDQIRWMVATPEYEAGSNPPAKHPSSIWFSPYVADRAEGETEEDKSIGFEQAGYFVSRGGSASPDYSAMIDCGELGYLSLAAHGHADCLSLAVSIDGEPFIVDPGTFCYHTQRRWREYFRSTRSHNTIEIDGKSQSQSKGPFIWGERARPVSCHWNRGQLADWFSGAHDGYKRSGILHSRKVLFVKSSYAIIVDHVDGEGFHQVRSSLQLAPGELSVSDSFATYSSDSETGSCSGVLHWLTPEGMDAASFRGTDAEGGWISMGFLQKEVSPTLCLKGRIKLPAMIVLVLVPGSSTSQPVLSVESKYPGEHFCFRVCSDDWSDFCCVGNGGNEKYRLEGEVAVVRRQRGKTHFIGADVKEFRTETEIVEGGGEGGLLERILEEP